MIRINVADIGPDGKELSGIEPSAFLDLDSADGVRVKVVSDVEYHLHASLVGHDLLVQGSAFTQIATQCARCLKDITLKIGSGKICIFREKVPEEMIDLTDEVREDILLSLPVRYLCSDDCRGLCPGCGADLNTESCHCRQKKKQTPKKEDHTWDALNDLKL